MKEAEAATVPAESALFVVAVLLGDRVARGDDQLVERLQVLSVGAHSHEGGVQQLLCGPADFLVELERAVQELAQVGRSLLRVLVLRLVRRGRDQEQRLQ